MNYKPFTSFDGIDKRLRVLKLQKEIERESIKLNLYRVKRNISPPHLLNKISVASKLMLSVLAGKLLKKIGP